MIYSSTGEPISISNSNTTQKSENAVSIPETHSTCNNMTVASPKMHLFSPGDSVRVELDVEIFKVMQEGHGDFDEKLLEVCELVFVYTFTM